MFKLQMICNYDGSEGGSQVKDEDGVKGKQNVSF